MLKFTVEAVHPKDSELAMTMEAAMNAMVTNGEFDALADRAFEDGLVEWLKHGEPA